MGSQGFSGDKYLAWIVAAAETAGDGIRNSTTRRDVLPGPPRSPMDGVSLPSSLTRPGQPRCGSAIGVAEFAAIPGTEGARNVFWQLEGRWIGFRGENRYCQFRGEFYNAWNHAEFNGYDTGARFNPAGQQINANFGALNGTRDPRKIQLSLRLMF